MAKKQKPKTERSENIKVAGLKTMTIGAPAAAVQTPKQMILALVTEATKKGLAWFQAYHTPTYQPAIDELKAEGAIFFNRTLCGYQLNTKENTDGKEAREVPQARKA